MRLDTAGGLRQPRAELHANATTVSYLLLAVLAAGDLAGIVTAAR